MSDFEDPTQLARCIKSDCQAYRAGNTPLCAQHLREQEVTAGATSIVEPDVEARVAAIRTEDDDHPGMVKIYDRETGKPSWVPAAPKTQVLMDPDLNGAMPLDALGVPYRGDEPGLRPDPADMEPRWDAARREWVLRPKRRGVDLNAVRSLVRELMHELGIGEEDGNDHA